MAPEIKAQHREDNLNKDMITIVDITKVYRMGEIEVRALNGVSLCVNEGEWVAITGPSGSGKSTLMNIIGCLDQPTAGTYMLDGIDVGRMNDDQLAAVRNRKIGFVFQTFNLLAAHHGAGQRRAAAGLRRDRRPKQRRERPWPPWNALGLGDRVNHRPNELSGGQQQRVAIARALINNPAIILADEPTGNLDSKSGAEIMAIFRSLHDQGMTIVMVTHDPDIAAQCERMIHIKDGLVASDEISGARHRPWRCQACRR